MKFQKNHKAMKLILCYQPFFYPNFPDNILPDKLDFEGCDGEYTIEVGVIIEKQHFKGYYEPETDKWWIDYGGFTVGHRQTDTDEIEGWYYLP